MDARNFTYMFYGFAAAWLILVIYVISMVARQRKLNDELRRVREIVEEKPRR